MDIIKFVLGDFWHFVGAAILLSIISRFTLLYVNREVNTTVKREKK